MSYYTFNKVLSGIESKTCLTVQSLPNPEYVYDFIPFLLGFFCPLLVLSVTNFKVQLATLEHSHEVYLRNTRETRFLVLFYYKDLKNWIAFIAPWITIRVSLSPSPHSLSLYFSLLLIFSPVGMARQ